MFGLDARIALAIFGALSVISGAALYSAIENAKTVAYYQTFNEIVKATEAYWLDTGERLKIDGTSIEAGALIQNDQNLRSWSGPYMSATYSNEYSFYINIQGKDHWFGMLKETDLAWNEGSIDACEAPACYEWIRLSASTIQGVIDIFNLLDKKYDNGDGGLNGRIRYRSAGRNPGYVIFRGISRN